MRYAYIISLVVLLWLIQGCNHANERLDTSLVKQLLIEPEVIGYSDDTSLVLDCNVSGSVWGNNLDLGYEAAIKKLGLVFDSIEQLQLNSSEKKYLKCLVLAGFTSNIFSWQFMGSKFGLTADQPGLPQWNRMSNAERYRAGNTNQYAVWCGNRSSFFTALLDSMLHLQAEEVSVPGVHTYPVVSIGKLKYIFDPFDVVVAIDTTENKILDYETLKNNAYRSIAVYDVKPRFGKCAALISDSFYHMLKDKYTQADTGICVMLNKYLQKESGSILRAAGICGPFAILKNPAEIRPVRSPNNSYVLVSDFKFGSTKQHIPDFYRQYFGRLCK